MENMENTENTENMENTENNECSICLEELYRKKTKTLTCNHIFHMDCIDEWGKIQTICPLCRKYFFNDIVLNGTSIKNPFISYKITSDDTKIYIKRFCLCFEYHTTFFYFSQIKKIKYKSNIFEIEYIENLVNLRKKILKFRSLNCYNLFLFITNKISIIT